MSSALTKPERSILAECEAVIERGRDTFIEVGNALLQIRDGRLYDKKPGHAGFADFETYCRKRWQMSRFYAHRMIEAAEVVENLLPIGNKPQSESQIRPLSQLPPQQQREVWREAAATAKTPGKPTAKEVELVVEKRTHPERINYTPSNGLQYAQMAIDSLEKIQPSDTQRTRAFQKVKNWIAQQEAKS